jgi:RNA polymerase sigma-70 factor, ECF subfamily
VIRSQDQPDAEFARGATPEPAIELFPPELVSSLHDRGAEEAAQKPGWSSCDDLWVERIRKGDEAAFGALFRAFYKDLCQFVHQYVRSEEIAEDNVQEIFLGIWVRRETWDPKGPIKPYLFRAARNRALNALRNHRTEFRWRDGSRRESRREPTPEDNLVYQELSAAIEQTIEGLPDRCREIFRLSRRSGLRHTEIASLLNISVKTVETQMGRALRALRRVVTQVRGEDA